MRKVATTRRCRRSARAATGSTRRWPPTPARRARRSPAPPTADVCIVGGGFAGLWTAYELTEREPGLQVVLLEAAVCGAGGSGANGGFFSSSWMFTGELCRRLGDEAGLRWATALGDQVGELGSWCERHHADIAYHHEGILYGQAGEWQTGPDHEALALLERHGLGERLRAVGAAEARRVADSPRLSGGVFTPDLATVQPARLARELRRVVLERGVRIYEGSRMVALRHGAAATVETAGGAVRAGQVVLTHGAWAAAEREFARAFAVGIDYMVVTEPIPELLAQIGWTSHDRPGRSPRDALLPAPHRRRSHRHRRRRHGARLRRPTSPGACSPRNAWPSLPPTGSSGCSRSLPACASSTPGAAPWT